MALGAHSCSGTTNLSGVAQCSFVVNGTLWASTPISAEFAGDTLYKPSSASATAVVFAFPTGGAFAERRCVLAWDDNVLAADWANVNVLTGGDAPSAFKGFVGNVSLPPSNPPASCGGPWTTAGGNSAPPPATGPSYMGVLVSSNVSKAGSRFPQRGPDRGREGQPGLRAESGKHGNRDGRGRVLSVNRSLQGGPCAVLQRCSEIQFVNGVVVERRSLIRPRVRLHGRS